MADLYKFVNRFMVYIEQHGLACYISLSEKERRLTNWMERLVGGTRARLLVLLRRSTQTVGDLAAAVGISDNAVRSHISALQRDGVVEEAGVERSTGGKPAQLYALTREGEELFPKAYALVLGELVRLLEEQEGRDGAVALLREVGKRAAAAGAGAGAGADGAAESRVVAAADALRELGGDLEVQPTDSGWRLRGYGCPLSGVVGRHPELCALVQAIVEEVTGLPVTECCEREGRPHCAFHVSAEP